MRCKRCKREDAEVIMKRHNAAFCRYCFLTFFENQVKRAIKDFRLISPEERVLVCVSGGKDSLVLWEVLLRLGYRAEGMYIDLGIGEYSKESKEKVLRFAKAKGRTPLIVSLCDEGMEIPDLKKKVRKKECSICGTVKRHFFNSVARKGGYPVVATGHNLDDEGSRLLGNILQWNMQHLEKQSPLLEETESGLVRKVKPLIRVTEYETACYALIRKIDYIVSECPLAEGATSLIYKDALNTLEEKIAGIKSHFFFGFLKEGNKALTKNRDDKRDPGVPDRSVCLSCGEPSFIDLCSYCRLKNEMVKERGGEIAK